MSAIGNAFESLGAGIKNMFEGAGRLLKGAFTLDLKGATMGAAQMLSGGLEAASAASNLTPQAMAVNTLMEGALLSFKELGKLGKLSERRPPEQLQRGLPMPPQLPR